MSYIETKKTKFTDKNILITVLKSEGLSVSENALMTEGYLTSNQEQDTRNVDILTVQNRHQLGFKLVEGVYQLVYDQDYTFDILDKLEQLYAVESINAQIAEQYNLTKLSHIVLEDGTIQMEVEVDEMVYT